MTVWIEEGYAVLMLNKDLQAEVLDLDPMAFEPHPSKWGEKGATVAHLERLDEATFRKAIGMAHGHARQYGNHAADGVPSTTTSPSTRSTISTSLPCQRII